MQIYADTSPHTDTRGMCASICSSCSPFAMRINWLRIPHSCVFVATEFHFVRRAHSVDQSAHWTPRSRLPIHHPPSATGCYLNCNAFSNCCSCVLSMQSCCCSFCGVRWTRFDVRCSTFWSLVLWTPGPQRGRGQSLGQLSNGQELGTIIERGFYLTWSPPN